MGTRVAQGSRTPWGERDAAMRRMSRLRRRVADEAVLMRRLPDEALRTEYLQAVLEYEAAHEAWMRSRAAAERAFRGGAPDTAEDLGS